MTCPKLATIHGKNIDLVEIEPKYFADIVTWRNDTENRKWFFSKSEWSLSGQQRWYENYCDNPTDIMFVILLKDGSAVGTVGLYNINEASRSAEIGRLLIGNKSCREKGLAKEAVCLCLDFGLSALNLCRITLEVYESNIRAIGLYESLGFVTEKQVKRRAEDGSIELVRAMSFGQD